MLKNRVAIVTGAAHGIGRAICLELAQQGAFVWACDILADKLAETKAIVNEACGELCDIGVVNVRDSQAVTDFVNRIKVRHGHVDILVNNAGGVAGQVSQSLEQVSNEDWHTIFGINLDGAFHFTRAVASIMKEQQKGAIVNISSGAGRSYSLTGIQAYASAKAGLIGFTRQTAREFGAYNVRVNCIAPGFVRSNPATEKQWEAMGEVGQARVLNSIAMHRLGEAADIGKAVVFFVSDNAGWITGQTISVDGGHWMLG